MSRALQDKRSCAAGPNVLAPSLKTESFQVCTEASTHRAPGVLVVTPVVSLLDLLSKTSFESRFTYELDRTGEIGLGNLGCQKNSGSRFTCFSVDCGSALFSGRGTEGWGSGGCRNRTTMSHEDR